MVATTFHVRQHARVRAHLLFDRTACVCNLPKPNQLHLAAYLSVVVLRIGAHNPWHLFVFFWQDHIIPYMADPRHAPDTLFFVCEEDFRFYAAEESVEPSTIGTQLQRLSKEPVAFDTLQEVPGSRSGTVNLRDVYMGRLQAAPLLGEESWEFGQPYEEWLQCVGAFYARPVKLSSAQLAAIDMTEELQDLVKLCTAAHRSGRGDLVWLSWDGFDRKGCKQRPAHACTLLAVSHRGACILNEAARAGAFKLKHWDLALLEWLYDHQEVEFIVRVSQCGPLQGPLEPVLRPPGLPTAAVDQVLGSTGHT